MDKGKVCEDAISRNTEEQSLPCPFLVNVLRAFNVFNQYLRPGINHQVAECGTHEELLGCGRIYARLWALQESAHQDSESGCEPSPVSGGVAVASAKKQVRGGC
jgi:hypothetical protein